MIVIVALVVGVGFLLWRESSLISDEDTKEPQNMSYRTDYLHPMLLDVIEWAKQNSINLQITSTARSFEKQSELYEIGRTTKNPWSPATPTMPLGPTVAPSRDPAQHSVRSDGYCHAFDFSYNMMTEEHRNALVRYAESIGVVWGGRWQKPDVVHFETPFWRNVPPIRRVNS